MEEILLSLANDVIQKLDKINKPKYFIGIAGIPGSGKSTISKLICDKINELYGKNVSISLPMDGFHKYKSELAQMNDPDEAFRRRGAHWTFSPDKLLKAILSIKQNNFGDFPSFDHLIGDPIENDIHVNQTHQIIIIEGNYLYLDLDIWSNIREEFDEKWYINVDLELAMERVRKRLEQMGLSKIEAKERAKYNDEQNALIIMETKKYATKIINPINDPRYEDK